MHHLSFILPWFHWEKCHKSFHLGEMRYYRRGERDQFQVGSTEAAWLQSMLSLPSSASALKCQDAVPVFKELLSSLKLAL